MWLDVPVEEIHTRLVADNTRPLLQNVNLKEKLRSLYEQRQSLYAQADLRITSSPEETPEQIAARVLAEIPTVLKQGIGI